MLRDRVDALQVCNPPDVFWPLALLLRAAGRPFVFDHHDLSPELYECKTDRPRPTVLRILRLFEKLSWRCASAVISTNESYRELAIARGGCAPDRVVVVRNGPTLAEVRHDGIPAPRATGEKERLNVVYLGVINPQDHVEAVVLTAERLVHLRGRDDWRVVVAGDGDSLPELRRLADERDLADVVTFTGWLEADEVGALLRSATIAVQPDPPTRMAQLSTMAKTVEYVARGLPVVAVDMLETRRTAGDAARTSPRATPTNSPRPSTSCSPTARPAPGCSGWHGPASRPNSPGTTRSRPTSGCGTGWCPSRRRPRRRKPPPTSRSRSTGSPPPDEPPSRPGPD